jgi:hypothetical protein
MSESKIIKIDRYETVLENGVIKYYAVAGKKRYEMPEAYKEMYNDRYLAIAERTLERPELFGVPATHYIPLRTV